MQVVTTVGLDIAKSVFQVHGVDAAGQVVIRRQLKRRYVHPAWCEGWEGVDPAIRTTHLCQRIVECVLLTGTWSAEGIMASGPVCRTNRPNTWLHRPMLQTWRKFLPTRRRPHMALSGHSIETCWSPLWGVEPTSESLRSVPDGQRKTSTAVAAKISDAMVTNATNAEARPTTSQ